MLSATMRDALGEDRVLYRCAKGGREGDVLSDGRGVSGQRDGRL